MMMKQVEAPVRLEGQCLGRDKVQYLIGIQCAPVLVGIKTANMVSIPLNCLYYILELIQDTGLTIVKLYEDKNSRRYLLLLYREELLGKHLRKKEILQFLRSYGYTGRMGVQQAIYWLVGRFQDYAYHHGEFPHEIGIFLEYPLDDIRSFILNKGHNSLTARYWKVYHNEEYARSIFNKYDIAKKVVIECLSDHIELTQSIKVYQSLYQVSSTVGKKDIRSRY